MIPPINNTYGLYTLMMFARMNGGGEKSVEPGFKVMKDEVNANVLAYEPSPGKMTELFQSGRRCWPCGARGACSRSPTRDTRSISSTRRRGR